MDRSSRLPQGIMPRHSGYMSNLNSVMPHINSGTNMSKSKGTPAKPRRTTRRSNHGSGVTAGIIHYITHSL